MHDFRARVQLVVETNQIPESYDESLAQLYKALQDFVDDFPLAQTKKQVFQSRVFETIYPCYLQTVTTRPDYFLSDIELSCVCQCAKQNVQSSH